MARHEQGIHRLLADCSFFVQQGRMEMNQADPPASRASGHRILVVDDNLDAARTLTMVFKIMGNEVCVAHDGLEGLEAAEEFRPDVIFLDIGMPKLSGYDVCRRIREQPWGKGILIVAQTGWGQEEDRRRSREAGFDHHLVKPIDPAAVSRLLTSLSSRN